MKRSLTRRFDEVLSTPYERPGIARECTLKANKLLPNAGYIRERRISSCPKCSNRDNRVARDIKRVTVIGKTVPKSDEFGAVRPVASLVDLGDSGRVTDEPGDDSRIGQVKRCNRRLRVSRRS